AASWRLGQLRARRKWADFLFAGEPCSVEVVVRNLGPKALPGVRLEDQGPAHVLRWYTGPLAPDSEVTWKGSVTLPHRGRYSWGSLGLSSGYPFGLVRRRVHLAPGEEVIVLPRLGSVHRGKLRRHLRGVDPRAERVRRQAHKHRAAQA